MLTAFYLSLVVVRFQKLFWPLVSEITPAAFFSLGIVGKFFIDVWEARTVVLTLGSFSESSKL